MSRQHATMANNSIINPITAFSDKLIDDFHTIVYPTIIISIGYSSRWSKEFRYDLDNHCFIKLQHLELEQLLCKVSSINKFINHTDYRNLFINMIDSYQLESDTSHQFWKTLNGMNNTLTACEQAILFKNYNNTTFK